MPVFPLGASLPKNHRERRQQLEERRFPWVLVYLRVAACGSVAPGSQRSIGLGELWLEPAGLCVVLEVLLPPSPAAAESLPSLCAGLTVPHLRVFPHSDVDLLVC